MSFSDKNIYSKECTKTVGCKFHRKWDRFFVRSPHHQLTGFTSIDTNNTYKHSSHDKDQNEQVAQLLCFFANHCTINTIMKIKCYPAKILEELDEKDAASV